MSLTSQLEGVTCPTVTPFRDGDVDEDALADLVASLVDGGVDGLFPCGTTGEFASLTAAERARVFELTVDYAEGTPVLAGAGATSVAETLSHVEAAADAGADAAVVVPPYFHGANDPAGERAFFEAVGDEADLPLLLYNIPSCTGAPISPEVVASLTTHETYIGLKDSGGDLGYFLRLLRETPEEFLLLQGFDNLLLPSLRMGADGGVNALSNVLPELFAELYESADDERADRIHERAIAPLFERCLDVGFAPGTKAALVETGVLPTDEVRPPLVPLDDVDPVASALDAAKRV